TIERETCSIESPSSATFPGGSSATSISAKPKKASPQCQTGPVTSVSRRSTAASWIPLTTEIAVTLPGVSVLRDQPILHSIELFLRLLVVVVTTDVEPVVLRLPRPHRLTLGDEPQDEIGKV